MKLTNPTDDILDAAFAIEIVGYKMLRQEMFGTHFVPRWCPPGTPDAVNMLALDTKPPGFTRSSDLVLPWMERSPFDVMITYSNTCMTWTVRLLGRFNSNKEFAGEANGADGEAMARAAVIALLRAHGHEIEFT